MTKFPFLCNYYCYIGWWWWWWWLY